MSKTCSAVVWMVLCVSVASAWAQEPSRSFDQLKVLVTPGDTISVTDASGHEVTGRLVRLDAAALALAVGSETRTLGASDVQRVRRRMNDSVLQGTLIGAGIGAGFATAVVLAYCAGEYCNGIPTAIAAFTGVGAGIGALVDAAIRGKHTIYLSQGTTMSRHVTVAPVITDTKQALFVRMQF